MKPKMAPMDTPHWITYNSDKHTFNKMGRMLKDNMRLIIKTDLDEDTTFRMFFYYGYEDVDEDDYSG